jgi:NADH-quinone oxidoreductase subunit N
MKLFVFGAASSAITLYGVSLIFGAGGTTNIAAAAVGISTGGLEVVALAGVALVIVGLGFKISLAPFHMWAPDVYEGAPTPISALLAAGSKKMGLIALLKLLLIALIAVKFNWALALGVLSVGTMFVGNILALEQRSVKRMLAYSSISQAGYLVIAFCVIREAGLHSAVGQFALMALLVHIVVHAFSKGGAFFVSIIVSGSGRKDDIDDYRGLLHTRPLVAIAMGIFLLSLAGIPPLAGFWSKLLLFGSAVYGSAIPGAGWLIWLAIFGIINSAISLYYYFRIIRKMYVRAPNEKRVPITVHLPTTREGGAIAAIAICAVIIVVIGLFPQEIIAIATKAAAGFG